MAILAAPSFFTVNSQIIAGEFPDLGIVLESENGDADADANADSGAASSGGAAAAAASASSSGSLGSSIDIAPSHPHKPASPQ
jgi:hypothetical protein